MSDTERPCVLCEYKLPKIKSNTAASPEHFHVIRFTINGLEHATAVKCPVVRPL